MYFFGFISYLIPPFNKCKISSVFVFIRNVIKSMLRMLPLMTMDKSSGGLSIHVGRIAHLNIMAAKRIVFLSSEV